MNVDAGTRKVLGYAMQEQMKNNLDLIWDLILEGDIVDENGTSIRPTNEKKTKENVKPKEKDTNEKFLTKCKLNVENCKFNQDGWCNNKEVVGGKICDPTNKYDYFVDRRSK